jgi:hypothetical protein
LSMESQRTRVSTAGRSDRFTSIYEVNKANLPWNPPMGE